MKTVTRYPTAPIQVWQKMKELRRWHGKHAGDAKKRGDLVVQGVVEAYLALFSGFGDFANPPFYLIIPIFWDKISNKNAGITLTVVEGRRG